MCQDNCGIQAGPEPPHPMIKKKGNLATIDYTWACNLKENGIVA